MTKNIVLIKRNAGRLDWCRKNNLIVFDKAGSDRKYFDVFIMRPDGAEIKSLTDGVRGIPQRHNGNPAWHPSDNYIIFQSEMENHFGPSAFSDPGSGVWCDLWLVTTDGKKFWKLTNYSGDWRGQGALHPHFSFDGSKVCWAERQGRLRGRRYDWGRWAIKVADFVIDEKGNPHLNNIKTYQPGEQVSFYETHGFSPDGSKIIFSANLNKDQYVTGIDIYTLDLITGELKNLTNSTVDWDEHAHYSPDGKYIVWMSSQGYQFSADANKWRTPQTDLRTDYWIMNADGANKRRLTYFNEAGHPEFLGYYAIVADNSWAPDGKALAVLVLDMKSFIANIYLIELDL